MAGKESQKSYDPIQRGYQEIRRFQPMLRFYHIFIQDHITEQRKTAKYLSVTNQYYIHEHFKTE